MAEARTTALAAPSMQAPQGALRLHWLTRTFLAHVPLAAADPGEESDNSDDEQALLDNGAGGALLPPDIALLLTTLPEAAWNRPSPSWPLISGMHPTTQPHLLPCYWDVGLHNVNGHSAGKAGTAQQAEASEAVQEGGEVGGAGAAAWGGGQAAGSSAAWLGRVLDEPRFVREFLGLQEWEAAASESGQEDGSG